MDILDGHMGHNGYRELQETLAWPHGTQLVQIFTLESAMTTRAVMCIEGHMGRIMCDS